MARKFCLTAAGVLCCTAAFAQQAQLDQARVELQAGRDQIIREELGLDQRRQADFWPIYQDYVAELAPLRERKAALIGKFMRAYESGEFSDEVADWLLDEHFAIKVEWVATQMKFARRFRTVLPVQKVARFVQLENKLDAEVDAQLAIAVPLLE